MPLRCRSHSTPRATTTRTTPVYARARVAVKRASSSQKSMAPKRSSRSPASSLSSSPAPVKTLVVVDAAPSAAENVNVLLDSPRQVAKILKPLADLSQEVAGNQVAGFTLRNDTAFRVFVTLAGKRVSPWHDVALFPSGRPCKVVNFVNEIPRGTVEKMEIATDEPLNPIKQDIKKEKLRQYPFQSLVNYGALPQTWEDPTHCDEDTGLLGDGDPVDLCEIGSRVIPCGEIRAVKIIGVLGMIDEGEMDWKVIGIDVCDRDASKLNSIADVERVKPGLVSKLIEWFRFYKVPDGKPENNFAFDGKPQDSDFALKIILETNAFWRDNKPGIKAKGLWLPAEVDGDDQGAAASASVVGEA